MTTCKSANRICNARIIFWNNSTLSVIGWILIHPCCLFLFCSRNLTPYFSSHLKAIGKKYNAEERREIQFNNFDCINKNNNFHFHTGRRKVIKRGFLIRCWIMNRRGNVKDWKIQIKKNRMTGWEWMGQEMERVSGVEGGQEIDKPQWEHEGTCDR